MFEFLVEVMQRFGVVLAAQINPFYFAAVERIGFLPREQIEAILRAFGHAVPGPVCGITAMADDGHFRRSVPWIWIAEPDGVCRAGDLPRFLEHELQHTWEWIANGLTVWEGHP